MSSDRFFTGTEDVTSRLLAAGPASKSISISHTITRADDPAALNERSLSQDTTLTATTTTTGTDTTATTANTMHSHGTSSTEALDDSSAALVPDALFGGVDALFEQLAALPMDCDSLVIGKVSVKSFRTIETERDRRRCHYRFLFLPDIARVVITIPTRRHERAHLSLFHLVIYAMRDMGLQHQWVGFGAETLAALGGVSAAGQGEGDSSGGPRLQHDGSVRVWPTLVIEAGATQTLPSLRMRARWWFTASDYAMKVVVLVNLISATCSIQIEKWIAAMPGPQRHGATTTRASRAGRQPAVDQLVLINWVGPSPLPQTPLTHRALAHFAVEGAPLVLRFHELMDRQPLAAAGEHDVSISEADLQHLAQQVWERM